MEEIKKIEVQGQQYGVADMLMRSVMGGNAQVIEWSHTHNMNDYKDACTYRIKGERTGNPMDDNLPIMNSGSGHTIDGILYVLDSSLTNGSGNADDCTITQFLMLSNRVGGQEGDMYMRSAYGANKDSLTWKPWEKYQTNRNVGAVTDDYTFNPSTLEIINYNGLKSLVDNGIYYGTYYTEEALAGERYKAQGFTMIVFNHSDANNKPRVVQVKFAQTAGGLFSTEYRSFIGNSWFGWYPIIGAGVSIGDGVSLGTGTLIDSGIQMFQADDKFVIAGSAGPINIGREAIIGTNVNIGEGVNITKEEISAYRNSYTFQYPVYKEEYGWAPSVTVTPSRLSGTWFRLTPNGKFDGTSDFMIGVDNRDTGEGFRLGGSEFWDHEDGTYVNNSYYMYLSKDNIRFRLYDDWEEVSTWTQLPYGLTIEPSEDGSKLVFSYNGKSAELPLT